MVIAETKYSIGTKVINKQNLKVDRLPEGSAGGFSKKGGVQ